MDNVALSKMVAAMALTSVTVLGLWTPLLCLRKAKGNTSPRPRMQLMAISRPLSLANCFSAGMLIAMSLVHFLPDAIVAAGVGVSPTRLCVALMIGVILPALMERCTADAATHEAHGHGHEFGLTHEGHHHRSLMSFIVLPMCLHAMVEGMLLGLEPSISSLLGSAVPLFIHRFFDGLVVGVCIAKELCIEVEDLDEVAPLNTTDNSTGSDLSAMFRRRVEKFSVILWLSIMPVALLLCVAITSGPGANGANNTLYNASPKHSRNAAGRNQNSSGSHGDGAWLALTQALGSGFFLFAGLVILMREELQGVRAAVSLSAGVLFTSFLTAMEAH
ncbi:putative zinc/iron permease [Trypanosoma conorhini]|uniref:Putative zinc/iron permease n=1 Tax=Trypanosoma conorhini TaxID=83891 RepID=A0A3R7LCM8_9TRYP|nr:putative zinc/iron permease [Trypanosoma conorhini]RNF20915.1 putative zinc/iron permease [Trypanosoma conorhini]